MTRSAFVLGAAAAAGLLGCTGDVGPDTSSTDFQSFEDFEANTYKEDFEGGVYIVNGDTPVVDKKNLYEFWESLYGAQALIVHTSGGTDAKWSDSQKLNLTYCVSNNFGTNKTKAVNAMNAASAAWEAVANVNFTHNTSQDSNCTASNTAVTFDVRPVSGQGYLARAFFPNQSRSTRNILIDSSAFGNTGVWTLNGIITHEVGHALGFRHEHTRPESGTCFEDNNWRPLTTYDSASVMHYPQCNGSQNGDLQITAKDAAGAAALYGAPGGNPDPDPDPDPDPGEGTPQTGSASGSVGYGQWVRYQPLSVLAGTRFTVNMTGTGDPDLYVRFGAQPTTSAFHCRPYIDGATEVCDLDVPAGQSQAYIGIRGYTSGTFTINVAWTAP
jgi:serine protease